MKYIFLDIDGVLNSTEYWESEERRKESEGMSDAQIMLIAHWIHLDPKALKLVNDLVDRSGAKVILSSTWRAKYSHEEITKMMQDRGATFEVIDSTPQLFGKVNSPRIPRGKEIGAYLDHLRFKPESFVIIDDHDDMLGLKDSLVKTNAKYGITGLDVEFALKILNGEVK
jgi:histidinol phosphatase-like enzyme